MANITVPIMSINGGLVLVEVTVNDANLNVGRFTVTNDSDYAVYLVASAPAVGAVTWTVPAHTTQFRVLGSFKLVATGDPGSPLSMGDFTTQIRWPA